METKYLPQLGMFQSSSSCCIALRLFSSPASWHHDDGQKLVSLKMCTLVASNVFFFRKIQWFVYNESSNWRVHPKLPNTLTISELWSNVQKFWPIARKEGKHRQARNNSGKKLYKWSTCIWRNLSTQMVFERTYGWHCHWLRKVENIDVNYSTPRLYHCNSPLALLDFWA